MSIFFLENFLTMNNEKLIYFINEKYVDSQEFKLNEQVWKEGDLLYEVLRVIAGVPLFFEKHIERLFYTAKVANFDLQYTADDLKKWLFILIQKNHSRVGNIKLIFVKNKYGFNFAMFYIKHYYPSENEYINGVSTALLFAERSKPNAKIENQNLRKQADETKEKLNVFEVILVNKDGTITEGSRTNIFFVKDRKIITSPSNKVLPGITREFIIDICKKNNFEIQYNQVNYTKLSDFDAVFLTGTSPKVLPVSNVGKIRFEKQNPIVQKIKEDYKQLINKYIEQVKNKLDVLKN